MNVRIRPINDSWVPEYPPSDVGSAGTNLLGRNPEFNVNKTINAHFNTTRYAFCEGFFFNISSSSTEMINKQNNEMFKKTTQRQSNLEKNSISLTLEIVIHV